MLIELKDINNEIFGINPDHIVEFNRIKDTDNYSLKSIVGERVISSAMAIYLHSSPTLSLSIIKLDESYLDICIKQSHASTMFPKLKPRVEVVTPDKTVFYKNDTCKVTANVYDTNKPLTWMSSDPSIASVTNTGDVTFHKIGIVSIIAQVEGLTPDAVVLNCSSVDVKVTPESKEMNVDSPQVTLNVTSLVTDKPVWSSTNTAVAIVDNDGLVTIKGHGNVEIKSTIRDEVSSCSITVLEPMISVSVDNLSMQREEQEHITVEVENLDNKEVYWISDNESVVTVIDGVVTAVGSGSTNIRVHASAVSKAIPVLVEPIIITCEKTKTLEEGETSTLVASVSGTELKVNYISSDVSVASIDPNTGSISALKAGVATLTAYVLDVKQECVLTVNEVLEEVSDM